MYAVCVAVSLKRAAGRVGSTDLDLSKWKPASELPLRVGT